MSSTARSAGARRAATAPGFWNDGTTTLTNATFANNSTVAGAGGAVWNDGVLLLDSSTVAGNGAAGGGGTNNASGTVEVRNTILSANTPDNCSGGIMSDGNNIDSGGSCTPTVAGDLPNTDPLLGPLQLNSPGPSFLETRAPLAGSPAIDAAAGCPRRARTSGVWPARRDRAVTSAPWRRARSPRRRPRSRRARSATNCVDDDGDGRTDYEDPSCCTQTAAMQVKKVLIVPGPAGATKGHLSLTAILARAGFADVDPPRDDVTVQFRNQNGELLCATVPHQRWKRAKHRGPFQFGDPAGTVAQGLRKMQIKVQKSGSARFLTTGKKMDLDRYARPELTATVRIGDRCSRGPVMLKHRGKKFVFP